MSNYQNTEWFIDLYQILIIVSHCHWFSMIKVTYIVFVILCNTTNLVFGFNNWNALHKVESSGKVFHHGNRVHLDGGIWVVLEKLYLPMPAVFVNGILTWCILHHLWSEFCHRSRWQSNSWRILGANNFD